MKTKLHTAVLALALCACSSSNNAPTAGNLPYTPGQTTVIGGDSFFNADAGVTAAAGGGILVGTPTGSSCITLNNVCAKPQDQCGENGTSDVLVDKDGTVLYIACYPTSGVSVVDAEGPIKNVGNNAVLVLDDKNDGVDVLGDLTIDGNNVTVYGAGPGSSVIGGNLNIAKNNSIVRGVRIQGNATISKNNGTLIDCVIEGDLTITGENVNVALCEVWGKTTVEANNAVLVSNKFASAPMIHAKTKACNDDVLFIDANHDQAVAPSEITGAFTCPVSQGASAGGPGKKP